MTSDNCSQIRRHRIGLSRDKNPDYYKIYDRFDLIMQKWNTINKQLHDLKQPRVFLFCQKSRLKAFYQPMEDLQKDFREWDALATKFLYNPNFTFIKDEERELGVLHFTNLLSNMINRLNINMFIIADNFVKLQMNHKNQVNFVIAIFATAISICGLSLAIYGLFIK